MQTVHFFGDSFVAGKGDPAGLGWVGRVSDAAREEGNPFRAVNHGVPGATSTEVVSKWLAATADPRNAELADTKVVFAFGTNDVINGVAAEDSLDALDEALERAAALHIPSFVVGPPPVGDLPDADAELLDLSFAFSDFCRLSGVPFLATHEALTADPAWTEETALGDGAHPQAGGYDALASYLIANSFLDWISH